MTVPTTKHKEYQGVALFLTDTLGLLLALPGFSLKCCGNPPSNGTRLAQSYFSKTVGAHRMTCINIAFLFVKWRWSGDLP